MGEKFTKSSVFHDSSILGTKHWRKQFDKTSTVLTDMSDAYISSNIDDGKRNLLDTTTVTHTANLSDTSIGNSTTSFNMDLTSVNETTVKNMNVLSTSVSDTVINTRSPTKNVQHQNLITRSIANVTCNESMNSAVDLIGGDSKRTPLCCSINAGSCIGRSQ